MRSVTNYNYYSIFFFSRSLLQQLVFELELKEIISESHHLDLFGRSAVARLWVACALTHDTDRGVLLYALLFLLAFCHLAARVVS